MTDLELWWGHWGELKWGRAALREWIGRPEGQAPQPAGTNS